MRKRKMPIEENNRLVGKIENVETTYYLSAHGATARRATDEGRIDIAARIASIAPKFKRFADLPIEVTLLVERVYVEEGRTAPSDRPLLFSVRLNKHGGSCLAYLPSDAFWEIPRLIDAGRFTHIDIGFGTMHQGHADLQHLYFCPESKLDAE